MLDGNICALLATKDHVNVFHYDGGIVADPHRIITGGHTNKTARTVAISEGDPVNASALSAMFKQIIANNRAGGWRKLKPDPRPTASLYVPFPLASRTCTSDHWLVHQRRRWSDFSPRQQTAIVLGAIAELVMTTVALRDLVRRPAREVRGWKSLWLLGFVVQPIGPMLYFLVGRRRSVR